MMSIKGQVINVIEDTIVGIEDVKYPMSVVFSDTAGNGVDFFISVQVQGKPFCIVEGSIGREYSLNYGFRDMDVRGLVDIVPGIFNDYGKTELVPGIFFKYTTVTGDTNSDDLLGTIKDVIIKGYNQAVIRGNRFEELWAILRGYNYKKHGKLHFRTLDGTVILKQDYGDSDLLNVYVSIGKYNKNVSKTHDWVGSDEFRDFMAKVDDLNKTYLNEEAERKRIIKELKVKSDSICRDGIDSIN